MVKAKLFLICIFLIFIHSAISQETQNPYTARSYWEAELNSTYQNILKKKEKNQIISPAEEQYYDEYFSYLKSFFGRLSEVEKQKYFEFKKKKKDTNIET